MNKTDIEIAQSVTPKHILDVAKQAGIAKAALELYGNNKAKIDLSVRQRKKRGKLVLVTAISPTPAGEGKTTTSIGLGDGLGQIGKRVVIALREPSLGPVFGIKGGATGGGYSQVIPMEDINLHFTGDFHAIAAANNLLAAMIDNHIFQGNQLKLDLEKIKWRRCVDMNDRALRNITIETPRQDGFDITAASEIMAILCLAENMSDLKARLGRIIVGYNTDGGAVLASDLGAQGAMATLLKDAIKPNLVQTLEGTPTILHGGPFANIAHGCNSLIATKMAMGLGDFVVTEAGFGADLGAEKFLNIKCRSSKLVPDAVVIVATVRALKYHGEGELGKGVLNLVRHIENVQNFGLNVVVAINNFVTDTKDEIQTIQRQCEKLGVEAILSRAWEMGGKGTEELAKKVVELCSKKPRIRFTYKESDSIKKKIESVAKKIYRANGVTLSPETKEQIKQIESMEYGNLPICIAKTQYSFSDNPKVLGAAENFDINVSGVRLCAGAGFVVVLTGNVMTMPGLPKIPAAEKIDIDENGKIKGLF
ncbi:MAG: formate--tetrahydrofolate ligase [Firmicutes bacterium]|nr:formate--tetrahydrofolate ligase [Bacillota bacterium]